MNLNITGVAGVAVPRAAAGNLTCTKISTVGLPLAADCEAALAKVQPWPVGEPKFCTLQFQPEYDYVTVGTCTIHTYSTGGNAHCLDENKIIEGVKEILKSCRFDFGEATGKYTGGQYQWSTSTDGKKYEGVRLVKAKQ